jgi:hypothetical protein
MHLDPIEHLADRPYRDFQRNDLLDEGLAHILDRLLVLPRQESFQLRQMVGREDEARHRLAQRHRHDQRNRRIPGAITLPLLTDLFGIGHVEFERLEQTLREQEHGEQRGHVVDRLVPGLALVIEIAAENLDHCAHGLRAGAEGVVQRVRKERECLLVGLFSRLDLGLTQILLCLVCTNIV